MSTLILYSTTDGHTLTICEQLNGFLTKKAQLVCLDENPEFDIQNYDTIILGASIRYGKHKPVVSEFIQANKSSLKEKNSVFFTVNLVARKANKNTPETNGYIQKLFAQTQWQPSIAWVFAGKLNYPAYKYFDKLMIRLIMRMTNGPTEPNTVKVFTDTDSIRALAEKINFL